MHECVCRICYIYRHVILFNLPFAFKLSFAVEASGGLSKIRTWFWNTWGYCNRGSPTGELYQCAKMELLYWLPKEANNGICFFNINLFAVCFQMLDYCLMLGYPFPGWCPRDDWDVEEGWHKFLDAYWRQAEHCHTDSSFMQFHFPRYLKLSPLNHSVQ